jgi:hypothetical protein
MISLAPILALLTPKPEGFGDFWFREVAGAAEFSLIFDKGLPLPGCWVVRASDKARHAGERAEEVSIAFDVVVGVSSVFDHTPGETDDLMLVYRQAVKALLLGYGYADCKPIKYEGGRMLEYADGYGNLYWADRYVFDALVTNYLPDPPRPQPPQPQQGE